MLSPAEGHVHRRGVILQDVETIATWRIGVDQVAKQARSVSTSAKKSS
jgi:hypothetical protein